MGSVRKSSKNISQKPLSGPTSTASQLPIFALDAGGSMSSQAVFPAKTSRRRANKQDSSTDIDRASIGKCGASSEISNRLSSCLRTYLLSELKERTTFSLHWKCSTTPCGREWWVLSMPVHRTSESASSLWDTPRASQLNKPPGESETRRKHPSLSTQVLFATPAARDYRGGGCQADMNRKSPNLPTQVLFSTPRSRESGNWQRDTRGNIFLTLSGQVLLSRQDQESGNLIGKSRERLNPRWVAQLMGLPVDWLDEEPISSERSATATRRKSST